MSVNFQPLVHQWQEDQAALFVLTGSTPLASVLRSGRSQVYNEGVPAHRYNSTIIKLEALDWVPAEEAAQAYRQLQREAYGGRN